jgi:putative restriction endonuclease
VAIAGDLDDAIRAAAFAYLDEVRTNFGGLANRAQLEAFEFRGRRVPLIPRQRGIWKPAWLECALSIVTTYTRPNERPPYEDEIGEDGYPRYKWRGTDPYAYDNVGLRRARELGKPLMWFIGVRPGVYDPLYPVTLAGEEPEQHQFVLAVDETMQRGWHPGLVSASSFDPTRRYAEAVVRVRLHQRVFRDRVLLAYGSQCALCRLRHPELLDAAHIRGDAQSGEPIVPNGIAMCAIHHRAFDWNVLGVRPDYKVEIRGDVLAEADGPTLRYALQGLHGEGIVVPIRRAERPDRELLEERYERFRLVG